jgi:hypothetical protein
VWWWQFKPEEMANIMKDFDEPGHLAPTGLFLGPTKYMVIQGEPGAVIRGKKVMHDCPSLLCCSPGFYSLFLTSNSVSVNTKLAALHVAQPWILFLDRSRVIRRETLAIVQAILLKNYSFLPYPGNWK